MSDHDPIADRISLCEGKARYCRFLDTKDWTAFADLMTEDYELDVSDGTGLDPIRGREAAVDMTRKSVGEAKTCHHVHSPEIALQGDDARVIWAMEDRVIWSDDRPSMTGYGHYHERWVRQNGDWKIATLKLTRLFLDISGAGSP